METMDETADIYQLINKMRTVQAMNDTSIAETHVIKKIDYERIFLVGYGDLHIENMGTDLDRIEMELKVMSQIPNLYVVFMGDLTDSSVKYLNNNFDTYLTPKAAREFGYRIFDALGEKLICALSGCHEKHSEEVADFDYVEEYCKRKGVPFLDERGLLTLELANERILNIAVAHKAQGYSMYNPFHPAIRMVREKYPEADVVITAHQHQSGIAIQSEQDKPRAMMTIGSRKQGDRYATRRGFSPQLPNKNLPVLEVLPGGYKILNDIILLRNLGEKRKLEELKAMGFENAVPSGTYKTTEAMKEERRLRLKTAVIPLQPREAERVVAHLRKKQRDEVKSIDEARERAAQKKEDPANQAEEHPLTDKEVKKAEKRKKDRRRKRAYRAANKVADNEYMKLYMREYRKNKKKERDHK